jgi:hypothetical protein
VANRIDPRCLVPPVGCGGEMFADASPSVRIPFLAIMPGGRWIVITDNDGSDGWAKTTVLRLPAPA